MVRQVVCTGRMVRLARRRRGYSRLFGRARDHEALVFFQMQGRVGVSRLLAFLLQSAATIAFLDGGAGGRGRFLS